MPRGGAAPCGPCRRQAGGSFAPLLLALCGTEASAQTLGCFNYGYKYTPDMPSVKGQPFRQFKRPEECQAWCAATRGCKYFGFFLRSNECWLGDENATLVMASKRGAVSGPVECPRGNDNPCLERNAFPSPKFPGHNATESMQAWSSGQQPTGLQCFPRKEAGAYAGFPANCPDKKVIVLQDTRSLNDPWPGRCGGMRQVKDLHEKETCQSRCMLEPLCAIWQLRNATEQGGDYTCWHSIAGEGCYSDTEPKPVVAQRLQHGNFRVLMNLAGMQLASLWRVFDTTHFPKWEDGARECRLVCISFLLCQFWQYREGLGCFIEYPLQGGQYVVPYPLVKDSVMLSSSKNSMQHVRAGEFIQHFCRETGGVPLPLPTDAPMLFEAPHPLTTTTSTTSTTATATTAAPTATSTETVAATIAPAAAAAAAAADRSLEVPPSWQYKRQPSTTIASAAATGGTAALAAVPQAQLRVTDATGITGESGDATSSGRWLVLLVIALIAGTALIGVWVWVLKDSSYGGVTKPYMYSHSLSRDDLVGQPGPESFNVMMAGPGPYGGAGGYQQEMPGSPASMRPPMGGYNCLPQQGGVQGMYPNPMMFNAAPTMPSMGPGGPYGQMPLY